MKRVLTALVVTAALGMLPSVSEALCSATGEVPRIFISAAVVNIGVRASAPGSIFFNFTTPVANQAVISAALAAQASHQRVTIVGAAAACGAVVGGLSAGGAVVSIITAP